MAQMIRKQIYISPQHDRLLKRLAGEKKVSEAELIREAIDRQAESAAATPPSPEPSAWQEALRFMNRLPRPRTAKPRRVRREDAYTDRLRRWR